MSAFAEVRFICAKIYSGKVSLLAVNQSQRAKWRINMVRPVTGIKENVFALLKYIFACYAIQLRAQYPDHKIRNTAVIASGISAFARLGYIELVDARKKIPEHILPYIAHRIRRGRQPIWVPAKDFPRNALDLDSLMQPYLHGNEVLPSRRVRQTGKK